MFYIGDDGVMAIVVGDGDVAIGAGVTEDSNHNIKSFVRFGQPIEPGEIGADLLATGTPVEPIVKIVFKNIEALEVLQRCINKAREILEQPDAI